MITESEFSVMIVVENGNGLTRKWAIFPLMKENLVVDTFGSAGENAA